MNGNKFRSTDSEGIPAQDNISEELADMTAGIRNSIFVFRKGKKLVYYSIKRFII